MQIHITRFLKPVIFSGLAVVIGLGGCQTKMLKMPELPEISLSRESPAPVEEAPLREARQLLPVSGEIIVAPGDSIFSIATRYQITPQSIINDNQLVPHLGKPIPIMSSLKSIPNHDLKPLSDNCANNS